VDLQDKVAVVTGAGSGIGRGIAQALAARGARVAAVDIDGASAAETARLLMGAGGKGLGVQADTSAAADLSTSAEASTAGAPDTGAGPGEGSAPGAGSGPGDGPDSGRAAGPGAADDPGKGDQVTADQASPAEPAIPDRTRVVKPAIPARLPTADEDEDEHYIPPPPPPLPVLDSVAKGAWAGLFGGPAYLLIATSFGWVLPGWATFGAVAAFVGGFTVLVIRMGDKPSRGSGPDNGAVL